MITDAEAVQLARIRDAEADFYAEVLFLTIVRSTFSHGPGSQFSHQFNAYMGALPRIADAVISSFRDMQTRVLP